MKCLLLVCLFLILAEVSVLACYCPHCTTGHVCVGTDPNKFCVCVTDQPMGRRHAGVWTKLFGNKKGLKARTKHMKAPLRFRKKTKLSRLHRKKGGKKH